MEYLDKDRRPVASYKRRLPMPPAYPGHAQDANARLAASVLYFNFWRGVLGVNRPVDIDREVNQFLTMLFGRKYASGQMMDAPMRSLMVEPERVNQVPAGMTTSQFFANLDITSRQTGTGRPFSEVCGRAIVHAGFGGPGESLDVASVAGVFIPGAIMHHLAPDNPVFSLYCDTPRRRIIIFSSFGASKMLGLKLSMFDWDGPLQEVFFFRPPHYIQPGAIVQSGSFTVDETGKTHFTVLEKISTISEDRRRTDNPSQYQSSTFVFNASRH